MEEKQEKKQEPEFKGNLGIIWLIGILIILLGCTIAFTIVTKNENKNLKEELQDRSVQPTEQQEPETTEQEQTKAEEKTKEETVENEDKDAVEVIGTNIKFTELSKVAKLSKEINKDNTKIKYDLNNDGKKDEINIKIKDKETEEATIYYNNKKITDINLYNNNKIYIADLDKNDKCLDIILFTLGDSACTDYYVYKNINNSLKRVYREAGNGEGEIYIDGNNNFFIRDDAYLYLDKIITRDYCTINGQKAKGNIIKDSKIIGTSCKITIESCFHSKLNKCSISYPTEKYLKIGTKVTILGFEQANEKHEFAIKVKLENGTVGYLYVPKS